jgi:hypothetical protein
VVDRVGLQVRETNDIGSGAHLMGNDQVIGDGGDVHPVEGSGCTADLYRRGRSRRVGNGAIHQRLLNRHLGTRTADTDSMTRGLGHDTSRAATIAATSSSLGAGKISSLIGLRGSGGAWERSASDRQGAADTVRGAKASTASGGDRAHQKRSQSEHSEWR